MQIATTNLIALWLIFSIGCASSRSPAVQPSSGLRPGVIQVLNQASTNSGASNPLQLEIPASGMTLRAATEMVIGPLTTILTVKQSDKNWEARVYRPDYVQLVRNGEFLDFQLEVLASTPAGDCPLQDQDVVLISLWEQISLRNPSNSSPSQPTAKFYVSGPFAPFSGAKQLDSDNLSQYWQIEGEKAFPGVRQGCNAVVLTRIENGLRHRYVIPYVHRPSGQIATDDNKNISDAYWGKASADQFSTNWIYEDNAFDRLLDGDQLEFTAIELLPELDPSNLQPNEQPMLAPPTTKSRRQACSWPILNSVMH